MFQFTENGRFGRRLLLAGVILSASIIASAASAGECPADQKKPDARKPVDVEHVGVTDTVIATIDLEKEPANIKGRLFRMRKLTIEPNGIVPWHSHADRPDIIYIIEGEIQEYASNCAVPIVHKAGDVIPETSEVSHWWKNLGDKTVVLISVDLAKDPNDKNM
jgi:quercetin dioxygenase-like cupin family protein